jgi:hypothetical protein
MNEFFKLSTGVADGDEARVPDQGSADGGREVDSSK